MRVTPDFTRKINVLRCDAVGFRLEMQDEFPQVNRHCSIVSLCCPRPLGQCMAQHRSAGANHTAGSFPLV